MNPARPSRRKLATGYALLIGLPVMVLLALLHSGTGLVPSSPIAGSAKPARATASSLDLRQLVLQIAVILLVSRLTGLLFRRIRQPQVVGEMVAGILLGPSLFGWLAPGLYAHVFPPASLSYLNALSQVGLILFMFVVGVTLNHKELGEQGHAAVITSHASIVTPFCLGAGLALYLYPRLAPEGVSFTSFGLFMGSAMSITAFPVLARILTERKLTRTRIGTLSIACAAVDDVTGWCILASIVVVARAGQAAVPVWMTIAGSLIFVAVMIFGVKRLLSGFKRNFQKHGQLTENSLALMVVLAMFSALTTEALGIHLLFGAFLMGAIMPKDHPLVETVVHRMESVTVVVLLPLFFAFSGLRTSIGVVRGNMWFYAALVILIAIAGKFGGSMLAARFAGVAWREATALGILMNTRGLMELIALNIGLDIGVISPTVFTIMVLMALVTTLMTSPLLEWIYPARLLVVEDAAIPKRAASG